MQSIEQQIWKQAKLHPEKVAVKCGKNYTTYRHLTVCIKQASMFFRNCEQYSNGRSVIIAANKQLEFLYLYFGAHLAGLVAVPVDSETSPIRFQQIASEINPMCVIGFENQDTTYPKYRLQEINQIFLNCDDEDISDYSFPLMDNIADILFTTGTTGKPKGVPLTYKNEAAAVRNINSFIKNTSNDIEVLALPISHSFGIGRVRCCLANGQTIILIKSFVNTKKLFRTIEEENATGFSMVPSSWRFLKKMTGLRLADFSGQLRYIEMGSAYFSEEEKKSLAQLFPKTKIVMHYGLTEASRSSFLDLHDTTHLTSVGKAAPYTDIHIFDETGEELPANTEGEVCIKGEHVIKGYLNVSDEQLFYKTDFFRSGDLGFIDTEGYLYLKSRIKELINVGGKKVAPSEIENIILQIPGIKDCACIGIPDKEGILGEVIKAYIVKEATSDISFESIQKNIETKIESYKRPVEYEWINILPRTSSGKLLRIQLKDDSNNR